MDRDVASTIRRNIAGAPLRVAKRARDQRTPELPDHGDILRFDGAVRPCFRCGNRGAPMSETEFYEAKSVTPAITEDGEFVVLVIQVGNSTRLKIGLPHAAAADLAKNLAVVNSASIHPDPTLSGAVGFTRMTPVVSASAQATDAADQVALNLTDNQGLPHFFLLQSQTSAALRPQMRKAEEASKSASGLPKA